MRTEPMIRRAALCLVAALAGSLLAAGGCLSPTLPLPPPEPADTMRPSTTREDTWEIAGDCATGARVLIFNERTRVGAIAEDTDRRGRYFAEINATVCDVLTVSQQVVVEDEGEEVSASRSFVVEERTPGGVVSDVCP